MRWIGAIAKSTVGSRMKLLKQRDYRHQGQRLGDRSLDSSAEMSPPPDGFRGLSTFISRIFGLSRPTEGLGPVFPHNKKPLLRPRLDLAIAVRAFLHPLCSQSPFCRKE